MKFLGEGRFYTLSELLEHKLPKELSEEDKIIRAWVRRWFVEDVLNLFTLGLYGLCKKIFR